jgi:hypothetical protein
MKGEEGRSYEKLEEQSPLGHPGIPYLAPWQTAA